MAHIVIIIPTYNEAANILPTLNAINYITKKNSRHRWTTLVVDDKSPDGTANLAKSFKSNTLNVCLLSGDKKGLGIAMCNGLDHAIQKLHPDYIVTSEADLAYDPRHIPHMLNKLFMGYDAAIGSRHLAGGHVQGWTFNRTLHHFLANTVCATWIAGVTQVKDHNGAFRAIRVKGILDQINWKKLPIQGFAFFNYWCYLITQQTSKIYEFPIIYRFRTAGESKVSFNPKYIRTYLRDVIEYLSVCFKIRLHLI